MTAMGHKCPAPSCPLRVPSSQVACRGHWYALPAELRRRIWALYRSAPLSPEHMEALLEAQAFLRERYPAKSED